MNSIVVYRIVIGIWFMIVASGLTAQKPTIDLISSHHQYRHPEAIIDTGYSVTPFFKDGFLTPTAPAPKPYLKDEKEETKAASREKSPANSSIFGRKLNPIIIIIYITALK